MGLRTGEDAKAYFRDMAEAFSSEFAFMSELKGNSNIVSFVDFEVVPHEDGFSWDVFIRMELLEPFTSRLKESGVSGEEAVELGIDMCRALELCEQKNIIHREIKPANIFISPQGTYKLGDFCIARELEKTSPGLSKKGTYSYMAPEIYRGGEYGPNADIYSLGMVLYRLLNNNRLPFLPEYPAKIKYTDTEEANEKTGGRGTSGACQCRRRLDPDLCRVDLHEVQGRGPCEEDQRTVGVMHIK